MAGHLGELSTGAAIAQVYAQAAAAERLEHQAVQAASAPVRAAAAEILRWATREWVRRFGGISAPPDPVSWLGLAAEIEQHMTAPMPGSIVAVWSQKGLALGVAQGVRSVAGPAPALPVLADAIRGVARDTTEAVDRRYDAARKLLRTIPVEEHRDMVTALAPTHAAAGDVDRNTRWATNAAVNQGLHAVAEHHGAQLLWFSERDACVTCLALAGAVVDAGDSFDPDATFGDRPAGWWRPEGDEGPLRPPRHPRCRCRAEPWLGGSELPTALRREAERSILRGWRRPSESEGLRLRAADRLLRAGSDLPKSVQARARNAVRHRDFEYRGAA